MDEKKNYEIAQDRWTDAARLDNWEKTKYLDGIESPYVRMITSLMLENQRLADSVLPEQAIPEASEIISKVVPNLLAHKIVSVQPKLSPNSIVYFTKFTFAPEGFPEIKLTIEEEDMVSKTRKYKTFDDGPTDVDTFTKALVDEINNEILTDIHNNCGTVTTVKENEDHDWESLYGKITMTSGYIHRKTLRQRKYWMVVSPNTYAKHQKTLDCFKYGNYTVHIVDNFRENEILMGQKGETFYDSDYIWSPYIMIQKTPNIVSITRPGYLIRYGKKLTRSGSKSYARIMLPEDVTPFNFSSLNVKVSIK